MRAALTICAKDLKIRLRDRSALLVGIIVPLALASTWVPNVRLGTSIVPAFTRGPAVVAQACR